MKTITMTTITVFPPYDHNGTYKEDGIVFDDPLGDKLALNTNRVAELRVEDSSS